MVRSMASNGLSYWPFVRKASTWLRISSLTQRKMVDADLGEYVVSSRDASGKARP